MKIKLLTLLVPLLTIPFSESPETTEAFPPTSWEIKAEAKAPGFGGKKAQNKRNRRTRKINRKNGIGQQVTLEDYRFASVGGERKEANRG